MPYPYTRCRISRRTFTKSCISLLALAPVPTIADPMAVHSIGAFSISLELKSVAGSNGHHSFVIRVANPAGALTQLKSIQLFAPGDRVPRKASFDVAGGDVRPNYSGRLHLESSQYVMALAEFDDGTLVHDRRFASLGDA